MTFNQLGLQHLKVLELSILLQHLRLGKDYLKKHLSLKQFAELTQLAGLNTEQRKHLYVSSTEKSGNFALALNTVFTCIIGAWLGMAGFTGIGIGSPDLLITITALAAIISAYLGYYSAKSSKQNARGAITEQKLHNIQLNIIKRINQKRRKHIDKIIGLLNSALNSLQEDDQSILKQQPVENKFDSKEDIFNWLNEFNTVIEQKIKTLSKDVIYKIYITELTNCRTQLKKILSSNISIEEKNHESKLQQSLWTPREKNEQSNVIEILTDPTIATLPKYLPKNRSWIRSHFLNLLVSFLPTVIGGFGSMFVYFGGIPDMFAAFGIHTLKTIATHPLIKPIELLIALLITLYFGYTFMSNNYKNFQREQMLDKTQKQIAIEDATMIEINTRLNFLQKLKMQMTHITQIFKVLNQLTTYLHEKQAQLDEYMQKCLSFEKKIAVLQRTTFHTSAK